MNKKDYKTPELREWGSVRDVTQTGRTHPGQDNKAGSSTSQGQ